LRLSSFCAREKVLILLRGLPGSGKSSLAKAIVEASGDKGKG